MPPVQGHGDVHGGRICVGRIVGAHGLRGELSVHSFTAEADDIAAYGPVSVEPGGRRLTLRVVGRKKLGLIVRAEGVADRTAAEALRGCELFVARAALPPPDEDEFYHADLIGLAAVAEGPEGEAREASPLGRVTAVHEFGAGPVLEIALPGGEPGDGMPEGGKPAGGRTVLVPFTRAAVPLVDVAGGLLRIAALPGLLETEAEGAGASGAGAGTGTGLERGATEFRAGRP